MVVFDSGKKAGGIGMRNMKAQNQSLMMKWLWKFETNDNMPRKIVIIAKYGMEDNWTTNMESIPYSCTVWRAIRNLWPLLKERIRYKVGNG